MFRDFSIFLPLSLFSSVFFTNEVVRTHLSGRTGCRIYGGYGGQADSLCGFVPRLSRNRRANEVQNDWEKAITENAAYRNAGKLADEVRQENGPFEVWKSVALLYAVSRWLRCLESFENNDFYYSARS